LEEKKKKRSMSMSSFLLLSDDVVSHTAASCFARFGCMAEKDGVDVGADRTERKDDTSLQGMAGPGAVVRMRFGGDRAQHLGQPTLSRCGQKLALCRRKVPSVSVAFWLENWGTDSSSMAVISHG